MPCAVIFELFLFYWKQYWRKLISKTIGDDSCWIVASLTIVIEHRQNDKFKDCTLRKKYRRRRFGGSRFDLHCVGCTVVKKFTQSNCRYTVTGRLLKCLEYRNIHKTLSV